MKKSIKFILIFSLFFFNNINSYAAGSYSFSKHYLSYIDYFDIVGYFFLLLNFFLLLFLTIKKPHLKDILIIFLLIRVLLCFINVEIFSLPDSAGDAFKFIRIASEMSDKGLYENIVNPEFGKYFKHSYSWFLAILFSIFGESYLLAASLSISLGLLTIFFFDDLLKLLWGNQNFNRVIFLTTFIPSLTLYSVLPLREVVFVFTLLMAFLNAGKYLEYNNYKYLIFSVIFFFITGTIHGGGNVGLILFVFYITFRNFKIFLKKIIDLKISLFNLIILLISSIIIINYLSGNIVFSKLGSFTLMTDANYISKFATQRSFGDASYPKYLIPSSKIELIWIIPIKFFYFLFGPFLWDIKSAVHIIGFFEGLIIMYLFLILTISFRKIINNNLVLMLLICLFFYILAFSIGTSNFGTGFRHRAKFFIFIIALVAPFILKKKFGKSTNF